MINPKLIKKILKSFLFAFLLLVPTLYVLWIITGTNYFDVKNLFQTCSQIFCIGCVPQCTFYPSYYKLGTILAIFLSYLLFIYKFPKQFLAFASALTLTVISLIYALAFYYQATGQSNSISFVRHGYLLYMAIIIAPFVIMLLWYVFLRKVITNRKKTLIFLGIVFGFMALVKIFITAPVCRPGWFSVSRDGLLSYSIQRMVFRTYCPISPGRFIPTSGNVIINLE